MNCAPFEGQLAFQGFFESRRNPCAPTMEKTLGSFEPDQPSSVQAARSGTRQFIPRVRPMSEPDPRATPRARHSTPSGRRSRVGAAPVCGDPRSGSRPRLAALRLRLVEVQEGGGSGDGADRPGRRAPCPDNSRYQLGLARAAAGARPLAGCGRGARRVLELEPDSLNTRVDSQHGACSAAAGASPQRRRLCVPALARKPDDPHPRSAISERYCGK